MLNKLPTNKAKENMSGYKPLTREEEIKMFEEEYKLYGKYDKSSTERVKKVLASLGKPVPTLKDIYNKPEDSNRRNKLETKFVQDFMKHIIALTKTPKVQVERIVSPILGMFIEEIFNAKFKDDSNYSGKYELISPEFPLKKGGNYQSTNIDFLLLNREKKLILFLELKTDSSSYREEQYDIYLKYKNRIEEDSARIFIADIENIKLNSDKSDKYKAICEKLEKMKEELKQIRKVALVYLIPAKKLSEFKKKYPGDLFLSFSDLPDKINHQYSEYWSVIRKDLLKLDNN